VHHIITYARSGARNRSGTSEEAERARVEKKSRGCAPGPEHFTRGLVFVHNKTPTLRQYLLYYNIIYILLYVHCAELYTHTKTTAARTSHCYLYLSPLKAKRMRWPHVRARARRTLVTQCYVYSTLCRRQCAKKKIKENIEKITLHNDNDKTLYYYFIYFTTTHMDDGQRPIYKSL